MSTNDVFARDYEVYCTTYLLQNGYGQSLFDIPNEDSQKYIQELAMIKEKDDIFNSIIFQKNKTNFERKIEKLSSKQKGASTIRCPKCTQFMIEVASQKRRSDEGATYELKCTTCGFSKRIS